MTWQLGSSSKLYSVGDIFENGASFKATGSGNIQPNYNDEQRFQVADANSVRALTNASGVLLCSRALKCWVAHPQILKETLSYFYFICAVKDLIHLQLIIMSGLISLFLSISLWASTVYLKSINLNSFKILHLHLDNLTIIPLKLASHSTKLLNLNMTNFGKLLRCFEYQNIGDNW